MAQKSNFKSVAEAVKALGGETNVVKILNAHADNMIARKAYNANKNALLKYAMEQVKAGKLTLPGQTAGA